MEQRKIVIPISGIDRSMVGTTINGWKIICISDKDEEDNCMDFAGFRGKDCLRSVFDLLHWDGAVDAITFIKKDPNFHMLGFAKETDPEDPLFKLEVMIIVHAFRLFKTSQIGFWRPMDFSDSALKRMLEYDGFQYAHSNLELPVFSLQEDDQALFSEFLVRFHIQQFPSIATQMSFFFHEACKSQNKCVQFVLRITIMEMLIDGNAELSYRLRHHLAVFLGRNLEESNEIATKMKKMYEARSKYLHEGDASKISDEYCQLAFEYARRLIANLFMITDSIKDIRAKLESAGYGTDPYQVQF